VTAPEITDPLKFKELAAMNTAARIVLSETEKGSMLKDVIPPRCDSVLLAFGPEGGWSAQEIAAFHEAGWKSASLGNTILRAETAVIAAVAVAASMVPHR
jgi:16S rRNA (uracil1498-N3)-methyltransferase